MQKIAIKWQIFPKIDFWNIFRNLHIENMLFDYSYARNTLSDRKLASIEGKMLVFELVNRYFTRYIYIYIYIYLWWNSVLPDLDKNSRKHVDKLSGAKFFSTRSVFRGASNGEIRFHLTFLISDLWGVGFWSDFEILVENFEKYIVECVFMWIRRIWSQKFKLIKPCWEKNV